MAKSSYEYAAAALARPESAERAGARAAVVRAFGDSGGAYGYRRIAAQTGVGEWTVRAIMGEESLVARAAKKKRRWYRDVRLKSDLGYKSPMQYRRDLGLIA